MLGYLFRLSRPRFWLYTAGPVVVGVVYAAASAGALFTPLTVASLAYFLFPANVYLYGVNDRFDRAIDEANPKKGEGGREARWAGDPRVTAVVVLSGLLALPLAALAPPVAWPWLAGFLLLSTEYSAPPLRFKTTPYLDSLSNGLYLLPGAFAYTAVAGQHPPALAVVGGWLWTMAMHTYSAIPDIEPDRQAGVETTATRLGEAGTLAYCGVVWCLAAVAFGLLDYRLGLLLAVYPAFLVGQVLADLEVARAYWWYPAVNTVVGMVMTLGALVRIVPPSRVLGGLT